MKKNFIYLNDFWKTCCCVVHNYIMSEVEEIPFFDDNVQPPCCGESLAMRGCKSSSKAMKIRENFKDYFNSQQGQVPWQLAAVRRGQKD